jgi:integrase
MAIRKRTGRRGVTWQIDYTDPTGKRVRRNFKKKKDAVAELGKRQSLMAEGSYLDHKKTCDVTLGEMVDRYTAEYGNQASFNNSKKKWLENFKEYFDKDVPLDKITYGDVKAYRGHLRAKLTVKGTLRKDSSINKEMSALRHMFQEAVEVLENFDTSPFKKGRALHIKENNRSERFLSQEEIDRLLATTMPDWCKDTIEGILLTGMRRQEALGLKWQHVRNGLLYLGKTKTGDPRWLPINEDLREHLKALRAKHGLKSQYVFCDPNGNKIKGDSFSKAVKSVLKRACIDVMRPVHILRHTFASHFVMREGDLPSLQKMLGHDEINMTMRYAHLAPDYLKKSIEVMNGLTGQKSDEKVTSRVYNAPMTPIQSKSQEVVNG